MKILAVCGSPRSRGNTNYLVGEALKAASAEGIETEKISLGRYKVGPCLACKKCAELSVCAVKDDGGLILEKLLAADGIIFATPVYFYNVSAQMKALIDRCHFFYSHDLKPKAKTLGFIIIAGEFGVADTLHALHGFSEIAFDLPKRAVFSVGGIALEAGEVKNSRALVEQASRLGQKMANILLK